MSLETVLVPYDGSPVADTMLRFACGMVTGKKRVIALYIILLPTTFPLDPAPPSFDREGNSALDHAEVVAWQAGAPAETMLIRTRKRADAIVGVAREEHVDAICIPRDQKEATWHKLQFARTVRSVLRHAPCSVIIGTDTLPGSPGPQPGEPVQKESMLLESPVGTGHH